jgi:hypothetical protein
MLQADMHVENFKRKKLAPLKDIESNGKRIK